MSQHDFAIADPSGQNVRQATENALQALASTNKGPALSSTTYAGELALEDDVNILRMRNNANSGWLDIGYID